MADGVAAWQELLGLLCALYRLQDEVARVLIWLGSVIRRVCILASYNDERSMALLHRKLGPRSAPQALTVMAIIFPR